MAKRSISPESVPKQNPDRLIPIHVGGKVTNKEGKQELRTKREAKQERERVLEAAPNLEGILEKHLKSKGIEPPAEQNLSLLAIEEFERTAKEAQDLRRTVKDAKDPKERELATRLFTERKAILDEYLAQGPSFEAAFREYIRVRNKAIEFSSARSEIRELEQSLTEPAFASIPPLKKSSIEETPSGKSERLRRRDLTSRSRLETLARSTSAVITPEDQEKLEAALKTIYPEGSEAYRDALTAQTAAAAEPRSLGKRETSERIAELKNHVAELWQDPMVRYFYGRTEIESMITDLAMGEDVLETPSAIKVLNALHEWEHEHQRTTIGGVLVGPPGVGKTTEVRHYLEAKERKFIYIDLSEDVTRYLLYGSKSIEFNRPADYFQKLTKDLSGLDAEGFKQFVSEHAEVLTRVFGLSRDEAKTSLIGQIKEELERGNTDAPELTTQLAEAKAAVEGLAGQAFRRELASDFSHITTKNGWRDGVIISALRRGENVIFDEFNKNKNWSLIYGLLTAKPGERWFFADNNEWIQIPPDWRMYFTANIGRKHGGFEVAEALASRAEGKVMEVDYPPPAEEMRVALATLANPEGDFLRSNDDLAKLYVFVNEFLPRARNYMADKRQSIPLSYRTIRDLGEKLVLAREPKSGSPVYQATNKSFDEALNEVLLASYAVYEDKTIPKELANIATTMGLLLDIKIRGDITKWITPETFDERKKTFEEHHEDFKAITEKIRGMSKNMDAAVLPASRTF